MLGVMEPMLSTLATFVVAMTLAALGQPMDVPPPTQGYDLGDPGIGFELIVPLSIAQCEPFLIYYNNVENFELAIWIPDMEYVLIFISFPQGVGYLDWICNIPAGYSFAAQGLSVFQHYTVQAGSSSACLGDITSTNAFYAPDTAGFQSYTQHPAFRNSHQGPIDEQSTVAYPTSSFSILTINALVSATSSVSTSVSTSVSSTPALSIPTLPTPTMSSQDSGKPRGAIAGGVTGGVALVLLFLALVYVFLRRRRKRRSESETTPFVVGSERPDRPRLITSHLESTSTFAPFMLFPGHGPHSGGSEPTSGISPIAYIGTKTRPSASISPIVPQRLKHTNLTIQPPQSSMIETRDTRPDLASALDVVSQARLTASQRQTLIASLNDSPNRAGEMSSSNVQLSESEPLSQSSASEARDNVTDLATVLDVISRARLSTRERRVLSASLDVLGQMSEADATRGSMISSPPPYPG